MNESNVITNSFKAWFLAARPKTLTGAAVPVMIGIAAAIAQYGDTVRAGAAVLCMLFALVMQIDANFINDYFDFMKGTDDEKRLGPKRACAQGWITAAAMRLGLLYTTLLACAIGLPLIYYGGWEMILIGVACVVFCFLYTISFSYIGLGDVLVLVFFGLLPVCMTYWLVSPPTPLMSIPWQVITLSAACGLVIDTLLVVNNYRDIDNDRRAGKRTLIVRIGEHGGLTLYAILGFISTILALIGMAFLNWQDEQYAKLIILLYLPFHIVTFTEMRRIRKGAELNKVLGMTARNMLIYGILVTIGLLV
ncbi:1,4-dihydroxy-2-naphthoate octaprenyltransferase [Leyella stercorea]|uniref:1,4-dihydroxy-2-naphthoate octaprenyltransferase n=1 Tax=Leyella stercorea TaxID=363265 RepID=UPI0026DD6ECD|nr:1,4-dihydroxy-2-naphthoate octaprenyltransferase [Leyella stercorea]